MRLLLMLAAACVCFLSGAGAERMCSMSDVTNSCVAEACSGGQYEQWNTCTEAGMASSQDDCPDGCEYKPFRGKTDSGVCAVAGTSYPQVNEKHLTMITSAKCTDSEQDDPDCSEAVSAWLLETGCNVQCLLEQQKSAEKCGQATSDTCGDTTAPACPNDCAALSTSLAALFAAVLAFAALSL